MLASPAITQDELANLETQLQGVVTKAGASVLSCERWGKFRLAYPVNRNDYGVYLLLRFEASQLPTVVLENIRTILSVDQRNLVVRFVINMLDPKASLEYHRPPSLEETPPKEPGSFSRGEGRGRHEGRGGRPGFNRTRGPRPEGEYNRDNRGDRGDRGGSSEYRRGSSDRQRGYDAAPAHDKNESAGEHEMMNGEAE